LKNTQKTATGSTQKPSFAVKYKYAHKYFTARVYINCWVGLQHPIMLTQITGYPQGKPPFPCFVTPKNASKMRKGPGARSFLG
jgi:hypothetical protein